MKTAGLVLRNPNGKTATVYVEYSANRKVKRVPTGVKVVASLFNPKSDTILKEGSANPGKDTAHIQGERDRVNGILRDLHRALNRDATVEELSEALAAQAAPKPGELTVIQATRNHIADLEHNWAPATRKSHVTFLHNLEAYQQATKATWVAASLTIEDVNEFQHWLRATYNYENSTLKKRVDILKKVMRYVEESQPLALKLAKIKPLHALAKKRWFCFKLSDMAAIAALDLPQGGYLDRTRDLLMLQTFTGLRWSDIKQLGGHHIKADAIEVFMVKTSEWVRVPLLQPALDILKKYTTASGLELPRRSDVKQNKYLKELCQLVPDLQRLETILEDKGPKPVVKPLPAWQHVTTHTGRRSFITCALDEGIPPHVVRYWSGHKTAKAFDVYVNASNGQKAAMAQYNERITAKLGTN